MRRMFIRPLLIVIPGLVPRTHDRDDVRIKLGRFAELESQSS